MSPRALSLVGLLLASCSLASAQDTPNTAQAQAEVNTIKTAAELFQTHTGRAAASLEELVTQPADLAGKWQGPYLAEGKLPTDPWGKAYSLVAQGDGRVRIYSLGSDGAAGGEGEARDVEGFLGTAGATVAPAEQSLSLTVSLASDKVAVGESAQLTVTLTNTGSAPVTLPQLAEDRQIVSFDVQIDDGKVFPFERITPSPYQTKLDWPSVTLEPGKSLKALTVPFPILTTGKLKITTHYGRKSSPQLTNRPKAVSAAPVVVEMIAAANGGDEARVKMTTTYGPIQFRFFPREALGTCLHFARLITEGGKSQGKGELRLPFFEGLGFHRVIAGFMVQAGCPLGNGLGDAGFSIPAEFALPGADGQYPEKLRHVPGRVSMAHSSGSDDSAGSQFFICTATPTHLDGKYTCFGEVTRGLDVAMTISEVDADQSNKPKSDVTIGAIRLVAVKSN